jgi:hypothetical protein
MQNELRARQLSETPVQTEPAVAAAPAAVPAEPPKVETAPAGEPAVVPAETVSAVPAEEVTQVSSETDVLSKLTSLDPQAQELVKQALKAQREKDQEAVNRRIGKEVAKTKQLQEELARVQQAPPQTQPAATPPITLMPPMGAVPVPLAEVPDLQGLVNLQATTKETMRWAEAQLDRDDFPAEGVRVGNASYGKADLKAVARNARIMLEDQIPQRAQFFQARQIASQQALEQFPWMKDRNSREFVEMQSLARQFPFVENLPHRDLVLGVQIEGLKALAERKAKSASPAPAAAAAPRAKAPGDQAAIPATSGPSRTSEGAGRTQALHAEMGRLRKKGNVTGRDVTQFLAQKESMSSTR